LLERLLALHPRLIDLSLDRMWRLLAALDHPQDKAPPIIHIAGTNGKGSTAAMLRAMLEAEGHRVHAYHSPHLTRFHERIILGGEPIAEPLLEEILARVEAANQGRPITFFEVTTAAAFLAFAEHQADYLVLEVGLGGRLDATNVVTPKCTAITPISFDHQEFLGDTLLSIAEEKAGILTAGVPLILAPQESEIEALILNRAARAGAVVHLAGRDFTGAGKWRWHAICQWRQVSGFAATGVARRASNRQCWDSFGLRGLFRCGRGSHGDRTANRALAGAPAKTNARANADGIDGAPA
jgi:dihydrofolate synthase/folylpolyglutamate synthase